MRPRQTNGDGQRRCTEGSSSNNDGFKRGNRNEKPNHYETKKTSIIKNKGMYADLKCHIDIMVGKK